MVKTALVIMPSLVGSVMCLRDSASSENVESTFQIVAAERLRGFFGGQTPFQFEVKSKK
jgi:hypothetical protein